MSKVKFPKDSEVYCELLLVADGLIHNARLPTVSEIQQKVIDVGEYELILTLKLKK